MSLPQTYRAIQPDEKGQPILKQFPLQQPSTNQVLVKVEFAPINPTDILKLNGDFYSNSYDPNSRYGSEGSGIVAAVGDNLKRSFKVGDRVHVRFGSWSQYLLADSEEIYPILQEDISLEDASAHWVNAATVHHMAAVAEKGGHKAVIHTAAASAVGKLLIRYFKQKGIKSINVVRREEQVEELKKEGADYVLNSTALDFEDKLKELAEKEKATLAFEAVAGEFTNVILKSQPAGSTCLVYGVLGGFDVKDISIMELFKGKTIGGHYLPDHMEEYTRKGELEKLFKELHELLPTVFKTHIHKVFKVQEINEAFAYYEKNSSKGKVVLKLN